MNPSPYSTTFKSAHGRARIAKILLIAGAIAAGLSLLAESLSLLFPPLRDDQEIGDNPSGAVLMLIILLFALLEFIIYVATVVLFLMWLYRAADNVRAFDPSRRLTYTPGWTVGSFFIPFANLVAPYRAVKDVWKKSGPPGEDRFSEPSPPVWFPIWWVFWLLSSFAGNISMRASFDEKVPDSNATIISIVASALGIVAAVFAYLVVDAIDNRQEETSGTLGLRRFSGPPLPPPPPSNLQMSDVYRSS